MQPGLWPPLDRIPSAAPAAAGLVRPILDGAADEDHAVDEQPRGAALEAASRRAAAAGFHGDAHTDDGRVHAKAAGGCERGTRRRGNGRVTAAGAAAGERWREQQLNACVLSQYDQITRSGS